MTPATCPPVWIWRSISSVYRLVHYVSVSFESLTFSVIVIVPHIALQITFLEFFEVLLGSTEVKCRQVSVGQEGQSLSSPKDLHEGEASEKILEITNSPSQSVRLFLEPLMTSAHLTTLCKECSHSSKLCLLYFYYWVKLAIWHKKIMYRVLSW